jgi:hypothetical protein
LGFLDHKGGAEYPYFKEDVFNALIQAANKIKGMKIEKVDRLSGHILVKAGVSMMSWGENIPISVVEIAYGRTRVEVISTPKTGIAFGGAFDFGKNRGNIEKILEATSRELSKYPPVPPQTFQKPSEGDIAGRLQKLKTLLDSGAISTDDYEKRKGEILSQL